MNAENERATIRAQYPAEFDDGVRRVLSPHQTVDGPRAPGSYPKGFTSWTLARRNAWFAGFNKGYHERPKQKADT